MMTNKADRSSHSHRSNQSDWHKIALAVRSHLEGSPARLRGQDLADLGKPYGIRGDTLRRFVAAANFLDRLHQNESKSRHRWFGAGLAQKLSQVPVAAVEIIARWVGYDEEGAFMAAAEFAQGYGSVRTLRSDELKARIKSDKMTWGRAGDLALREMLAPEIRNLIERDSGCTYSEDLPAGYDPKGVDFLFVSVPNPKQRIAVAIFGPYQDQRLYSYRKDDFLLKILGLSRAYNAVIGIIPNRERASDFEKWLDHFFEVNATFHYLDQQNLEIHSPRPIQQLQSEPRQIR